ncbi:lysine-specific demethylase JMJ32 [Castanea sativa]|uniref:lysine-specific demethylase JMJ32 n=1 Tax=Castanea sativa TaxID=21020 RepID=UPI003F64E12E
MNKELEALWEEVRELSLGNSTEIDHLNSPPTPLQFLRDYVSQNKPCLISSATLHWPALSSWSQHTYLTQSLSASPNVSVHLTPHGNADALVPFPNTNNNNNNLCFASPHVQQLPFREALHLITTNSDSNSNTQKFVAYLQQQNDCFRSEYSALSSDCDDHIPWATEALGSLPEAVNLWIGNHRSVTSFHKDHYENLYAVVSGEKHFLLLPPTDYHRMYIRNYPAARYSYSQESGEFALELEKPARYVPWCSVNPCLSPENMEAEMSKFPLYFNGPKPFQCTVKPGQILYLPSMWFHHVRQSPDAGGRTIAINYWYDMQFDIKYAYFNFLKSIQYRSIHDPTLPETASKETDTESDCDSIAYGFKDEFSANGSVENLVGGSTKEE